MPKARVKKLTIAHVYDDGAEAEFEIEGKKADDGDYVTIKNDDDMIFVTPEIWPKMVETVGELFLKMGAERQIAHEKAQAEAKTKQEPAQ